MKVDRINGFCPVNRQSFGVSLPRVYFSVDTFVAQDTKCITAETDLIRALAKRHKEIYPALKERLIAGYDVPLIKTLLVNPVFDDIKILKEIPQMLSVKWPREISNRQCAQGRKNIADKFASNPIFSKNEALRERIGEIILNSRTAESSELVCGFMDKIASEPLLAQNENLSQRLPDLIVKLQDGLYDSKVDTKGIRKGYDSILDRFLASEKIYTNKNISSNLGNLMTTWAELTNMVGSKDLLINI